MYLKNKYFQVIIGSVYLQACGFRYQDTVTFIITLAQASPSELSVALHISTWGCSHVCSFLELGHLFWAASGTTWGRRAAGRNPTSAKSSAKTVSQQGVAFLE